MGALHCMDHLVDIVASLPEVGRCRYLHHDEDENVDDKKDGGGTESSFEREKGVD